MAQPLAERGRLEYSVRKSSSTPQPVTVLAAHVFRHRGIMRLQAPRDNPGGKPQRDQAFLPALGQARQKRRYRIGINSETTMKVAAFTERAGDFVDASGIGLGIQIDVDRTDHFLGRMKSRTENRKAADDHEIAMANQPLCRGEKACQFKPLHA